MELHQRKENEKESEKGSEKESEKENEKESEKGSEKESEKGRVHINQIFWGVRAGVDFYLIQQK